MIKVIRHVLTVDSGSIQFWFWFGNLFHRLNALNGKNRVNGSPPCAAPDLVASFGSPPKRQAIGSYQRELQIRDGVAPNAHNHALNQDEPNKDDTCLWCMHGRFGTVSIFLADMKKTTQPCAPLRTKHDKNKHLFSTKYARARYQKQKPTRKHKPIHPWAFCTIKQAPSGNGPVQIQESWHCHFLREIQNASSHHGMI